MKGWLVRSLPVLVIAVFLLTSTAMAETIYDFNSANELNNFNKVLVQNDTIQPFKDSVASIVVANSALALTSSQGYAGIEIPAQNGYFYGVVGNNIWIGAVSNGTIVGSIKVDKVGYAKVDDGEVILSDGVTKIAVESQADYIIVYGNSGSVDKIAIISPAEFNTRVPLNAGNHLYSWSGSQDWMTLAHLRSGVTYRITFNQGSYDWDFFLFAPSNPHYSQASANQRWGWLDSYRDLKIFADSGQESRNYQAPTTGNYKLIVKHFSDRAPGHTWHLYVDQLSGTNSGSSPPPASVINNIPDDTANDNPSAPIGIPHVNNDNTKLILFGIGIIVVVLIIVGLTGRR